MIISVNFCAIPCVWMLFIQFQFKLVGFKRPPNHLVLGFELSNTTTAFSESRGGKRRVTFNFCLQREEKRALEVTEAMRPASDTCPMTLHMLLRLIRMVRCSGVHDKARKCKRGRITSDLPALALQVFDKPLQTRKFWTHSFSKRLFFACPCGYPLHWN